jgi:hypothetical protein
LLEKAQTAKKNPAFDLSHLNIKNTTRASSPELPSSSSSSKVRTHTGQLKKKNSSSQHGIYEQLFKIHRFE